MFYVFSFGLTLAAAVNCRIIRRRITKKNIETFFILKISFFKTVFKVYKFESQCNLLLYSPAVQSQMTSLLN